MKQLSFITLIAFMLMGCNASTASDSSNAAASTAGDNFAFLKKLGLNIDNVARLDGKVTFDEDNEVITDFTKAQEDALLKVVAEPFRMDDGEIEGGFAIIGIRALPNGHTLILYSVEFGDGSIKIIAIYDRDGNTTDYINTSNWNDMTGGESNADYTHGTAYGDKTELIFDSPSTFVLDRKHSHFEWTSTKGEYEYKPTREFWSINKTYSYSISNDGKLTLTGIKASKTGEPDEEIVLLDEIEDFNYSTSNDNSVFDKLNAIALRPEVKRYADNEEGRMIYSMMNMVQNLYNTKTQQMLKWMSDHRDLNKNALTGLLERCFSDAWIPKEQLVKDINQMPDQSAKTYISELTAQWGPADAVG